ncbi:MAG: S-layer homology domain-containing protein [Oscillospiraceae bacterium]|nr:S-layer homology domain-containing protein [Oscillospiraceae bacterium]
MKRSGLRGLLTLALCLCLALPAAADAPAEAELPAEGVYCFSGEELENRAELQGVFFTQLPEAAQATVYLGNRALRPGDAVARNDLARLRVEPKAGGDLRISYLPLEQGRLGAETVQTMHLERTEAQAPTALAGELETWRNLPNTGTLRGRSADEGPLSFQLESQPRRGTVDLNPDGTYTYTPKKNKVGADSFTFTVTDRAGNVSAPATVRVTIRKPSDAQTFADLDRDAQFAPLWLRETGLFSGEILSDRLCFGPERTVTRGEFLAMLMDLQGIEPEVGLRESGFADEGEAPAWMRPYLASALRRGLIRGTAQGSDLVFRPNQPITDTEAALLVGRALGLEALQAAASLEAGEGAWAAAAAEALAGAGIDFVPSGDPLTRRQAAELLYRSSRVAE